MCPCAFILPSVILGLSIKELCFQSRFVLKKPRIFFFFTFPLQDYDFLGNSFQHFIFLCHLQFGENPKHFLQYDRQVNIFLPFCKKHQYWSDLLWLCKDMAEVEKLFKKKLQELSEFPPSFDFIKQLLPLPEVAAGLLIVLSEYQLWAVIRHHKVTNCWVCTLLLICLSSTVHYMSKITVTFGLSIKLHYYYHPAS